MDRSKAMKSQGRHNNKFEVSGVAKASLSGQSKERPVFLYVGNGLKKKEVTKGKILVSSVNETNYDNMCREVNPLPKVAAADHTKKRINGSNDPANKKHLPPSIKAPIYPSSLLQHQITSCPVGRKPTAETLAKTFSPNFPVRAPPVRAVMKPTTNGNSRPSTSKRSSQLDTKKQPSQTVQQPAIGTTVKKVTIAQGTPSLQGNTSTITDNTTPSNHPLPTISNVSYRIVYATNSEHVLLYRSEKIMVRLKRSVCHRFCPHQL